MADGGHSRSSRMGGRRVRSITARAGILLALTAVAMLGACSDAPTPAGPDVPPPPGLDSSTARLRLINVTPATVEFLVDGNAVASVVCTSRKAWSATSGRDAMLRAPADGYTLLMMATSFVINPSLRSNLPYDSDKDFTPVTQIASTPFRSARRSAPSSCGVACSPSMT